MTKLSLAFFVSGAIVTASSAAALAAAGAMVLTGDVKVETTTVVNGVEKTVLALPKVVVPGNRLVFSTSYRNDSGSPVQNFVVTNPVPEGIAVSASDAARLTVSVDGGKSWGKLAALTVKNAKGVARAAQAADVTHVRWTLATIAPGSSGAVAYHAIVE
ncbi:hypothetical protein [Novosphingobium sp. Gsoil 351]|uniref:hypothetical protein n=1 Tax=Novosphingobium sp. Gsoil 351 TaxID=2675225 RepID=UPI0012B491CE|nr:hypothetical protein [Novosphingobium sp. Gsoil 351]QGN56170.1 hypothetical protein GKE62_18070 [Novosphingobium sp. Gsoil 351]